jgi:hypothetical protein
MMYPGFCGQSDAQRSPLADRERTMNWYPVRVAARNAPTQVVLYPTPGQTPWITTTDVGTRAITGEIEGRVFAIIGDSLWELFDSGSATERGTVKQDNELATISYNGITGRQLFITSGGNGYTYALTTNTLTLVLTNEATMGGAKDGRFLAFNVLNGRVRLSGLNDGLTWDPTLFFARSIAPDPWQAMVVGNPQIWMIGDRTSEAWYNAGTSPQPFAPILSSFMQSGTSAPFSVVLAGDAPMWLERNDFGSAKIVKVVGYTPTTISTDTVHTALTDIEEDAGLSDAETLIYQADGHTFACLSFPAARETWCVDLDSGDWHQRGYWSPLQNRFDVWRPRVHAYAFGRHLTGERATGSIASMSVGDGTESDSSVIRRVRIAPPLWAAATQRLIVSRLDVVMDTGLGLSTGLGSSPLAMLRSSTDSRTWGPERLCGAGAMGQYGTRVFWTRITSSKRVWFPELSVTDPIPWRVLGAEIQASGFQREKAA